MSSITIHDINTELDKQLTSEARRRKISKNRLTKELLSVSIGLPASGTFSDDYRKFCGLWNTNELKEFNKTQKENRQIDTGDWS